MKRIIKYGAIALITFTVFVITFIQFTRTELFHNYVRDRAKEEAEKFFNGNVYIGIIRGNFIDGFETDSVSIQIDHTPFFESGRAKFKYNLLPAIRGRYFLHAVEFLEPKIYIHKDRKSTRLNSSHVSESRMPSSA